MWEIFFVLRQTIFQSQPNDFSISGERFSVLRQVIFRSLCGGFPFCSGRFWNLPTTFSSFSMCFQPVSSPTVIGFERDLHAVGACSKSSSKKWNAPTACKSRSKPITVGEETGWKHIEKLENVVGKFQNRPLQNGKPPHRERKITCRRTENRSPEIEKSFG